jgi:electron transfer flavoprotein beta subunit
MKYKHARTVTELQNETKDYTELYSNRPYLLIDEWTADDLGATNEMLGLSGSPTKVKKIENVVFQHKESKIMGSSEKEIESLVQELISSHIIG